MSVQLGKGHFPIAGFFLICKNKVCLGEGCAFVPKCSSPWNFGHVLLISCKIYQVFEVDSGMRLKAAVWLHYFPPLKPNKDHVTVYFSSNLIYFSCDYLFARALFAIWLWDCWERCLESTAALRCWLWEKASLG